MALGDWQCSVFATLENSKDAIINISTSAQIGFISEKFSQNEICSIQNESVQYLPYFEGKFLTVGASLNGGNCLATFVKMIQKWSIDLGHNIPQCK